VVVEGYEIVSCLCEWFSQWDEHLKQVELMCAIEAPANFDFDYGIVATSGQWLLVIFFMVCTTH